VLEYYDWDYVVDQYERLFAKMAGQELPERDRANIERSEAASDRKKALSRSLRCDYFQIQTTAAADHGQISVPAESSPAARSLIEEPLPFTNEP